MQAHLSNIMKLVLDESNQKDLDFVETKQTALAFRRRLLIHYLGKQDENKEDSKSCSIEIIQAPHIDLT